MSKSYDDEISVVVTEWDEAGKNLNPSWIAHDLIKKHKAGLSAVKKHADFHRHFSYKAVRQDVGRFISKHYDLDEDQKASEPRFPGFDYVQHRYIVEREGDSVAVLADQLSDQEVDWLESRLRERGKACIAHADELRRFKTWRKKQAAA